MGWARTTSSSAAGAAAILEGDADADWSLILSTPASIAVDSANATVSSAEQIRRFQILTAAWTEESGHLTPTMKLKRNKVMEDFARDVEALYSSRV